MPLALEVQLQRFVNVNLSHCGLILPNKLLLKLWQRLLLGSSLRASCNSTLLG